MTLSLADLVAPLEPGEFLRSYWPHRLFTSNDEPGRRLALATLPELSSGRALLARYPKAVSLLHPGGRRSRARNGAEAVEWYESGHTCYLRNVSRHVPALAELEVQLAGELGVPSDALTCEVFCSDGTSGVAMHSDYDVNFSILLAGRKRWRLAPNRHIRNQTSVCLPGATQRDPRQLELADEVPFPDTMPDSAVVVDVQPGGLVFMPRGWWHETAAEGECLQVNVVMKGPHWAAVLARALSEALLEDPAWREYAYGVCGGPEDRRRANDALAALLPAARRWLDGDDADVAERVIAAAGLRHRDR